MRLTQCPQSPQECVSYILERGLGVPMKSVCKVLQRQTLHDLKSAELVTDKIDQMYRISEDYLKDIQVHILTTDWSGTEEDWGESPV